MFFHITFQQVEASPLYSGQAENECGPCIENRIDILFEKTLWLKNLARVCKSVLLSLSSFVDKLKAKFGISKY